MDFDTEDRLLPANHYRYANNGRSGTSDKDGEGAVELIRSTALRGTSVFNRGTVIGSCPDVKNNAVIFFRKKAGDIALTYTSATRISSTVIQIVNPSVGLPLGEQIRVVQTSNTFNAVIESVSGSNYTLIIKSGTFPAQSIVSVTIVTNNVIVRYFDDTQTFQFLTNPGLMGDVLNFEGNVYNPKVIESSFGQLLTWVQYPDGVPCLMNIDRMKSGAEYFNIADSFEYISLYKKPNINAPTFTFSTTTKPTLIRGKSFQFSTILVYDDGQQSVLSPFSDLAIVPITDNAITVSFNTGGETVKSVKLLAREGNGVSETGTVNTTWYEVYEAKDITPNTTETYEFTNTEAKRTVARLVSDKIQDAVPELASAIEVANTNQIVLADITEGKDNPELDITLTATSTLNDLNLDLLFAAPTNAISQTVTVAGSPQTITYAPTFGTPTALEVGSIFESNKYVLTNDYPISGIATINASVNCTLTFPGSIIANSFTFRVYKNASVIYEDVQGGSNSYSFSAVDVITSVQQNDQFYFTLEFFIAALTPPATADVGVSISAGSFQLLAFTGSFKTFKENSTAEIAIAYYDADKRTGGAIEIGSVELIPITNSNIPLISSGFIRVSDRRVRLSIANRPPEWASYYSVLVKETPYDYGWILTTDREYVDGNIVLTYNEFPQDYTPNVGDFVRVIGARISDGVYIPYPQGTYNVLKLESIDISTKKLTINGTWDLPDGLEIIIEVYKPKEISRFYFETELYEVGDVGLATRYHKGNLRDQNTTATITALTSVTGDSWIRYFGNYLVYSLSYNQSIESNYWDRGRPLIVVDGMSRKKLSNVFRWGNKLINNTQVNNLSEWDEGNYAQVDAKNGAITGLRQIGYTLKILQWANYNTAFIGRRELQNADGSTNLVVTDNLIGTINPSEMEFGTKYPGSIISTGRRVYFFDSLKSKYIVDDGNGLNEIAMYGGSDGSPSTTMSKYWRQVATMINGDADYNIITGFDYLYRDMYVSIVNRTENTQETLYYNETENSWKYFMDMEHVNADGDVKYIIDFYGNVGQSFYGFMIGNTFQFNKGVSGGDATYGQLFKINEDDPSKPLVVETIGMLDPDKVKVFLTHSLHANLRPTLVEITVPANEMYPNGMYTVLKPGNYAYREGVFYADIKRDAYTKGFTTDPNRLKANIAGGRPIRGHVCLVRITFTTTQYTKLFTTGIGMIPSELS
jgi:hypothetical protein